MDKAKSVGNMSDHHVCLHTDPIKKSVAAKMERIEVVDIKPVPAKPVTFSWTAPDNNGYRVNNQSRLCPWPEWSESAVNNERWGIAAPKTKDKKQATAAASTLSPNELFEEPMGKRFLFSDMEASTWVRLSEYYSALEEAGPVIWDEQEFVFDVLAPNKHLVKYKVLRQMISVLHALWELGNAGVLVNANHVAGGVGVVGGVGRPWRPWSLVYSMCRAGPGVPHQPLYNSSGKYLVRLFVLGCWRQVCVDDWCPLDREGRPLLLRSMKLTEFWPLVLSKALLQVLSSGRRSSADVEGHEIVTMLTGCMEMTVYMRHMKAEEVWKMVQEELLPRYMWPEPPVEIILNAQSATSSPQPTHTRQRPGEAGAGADKKGKADKAKSKKPLSQPSAEEKPEESEAVLQLRKKPFVLAMMEDMQDLYCAAADVPLDSELPHLVLVSRYRDVPLEKPPPRPPTPPWKNVRRYLWDPDLTDPPRPIQMLEVHTPLLDMSSPWTPSSSELATDAGELLHTDFTSFTAEPSPTSDATAGGGGEGLVTSESSAREPATTTTAGASDKTSKTSNKPSQSSSKPATSSAKPSKSGSKPTPTDSRKQSRAGSKAVAADNLKPSQGSTKSHKQEKAAEKKPSATQSLCHRKSSRPLGRVMSPSAPSIIMANSRETKTWIHMDEFCKVFSRLHLFYSVSALRNQCVISDLVAAPVAPPTAGSGRGDKDKAAAAKGNRLSASSRHSDGEHPLRRLEHTEPLYIFLDTLENSRIFISLHIAPPEPPPEPPAPPLPPPPQPAIITDEPVPTAAPAENPAAAVASENPAAPATTENPAAPATTENRGTPSTTENRGTPATVENSGTPATVENPGTPATVENPGTPATTENSATLSESHGTSVTSTETPGPPAAAPSLQATGSTHLATPQSEPPSEPQSEPQSEPPPAPPEPQSKPEPEPEEATAEPGSEPEPDPDPEPEPEPEPPEPPERRGATVVSEYCWSSAEPGQVLLTLGRRVPDSGAICLPAGRHVIQVLVTSGRGYALQLGSSSQFRCGTIRDLVHWLAEPPRRYLKTGSDVSDGLLQLMQNFIAETPSDHKKEMAAFCNIFCPETKPEERSLRIFYQETFLKCLCEVLPQLLGVTMNSDSVFPWRCFLMDTNHSMQCRRVGSPAPSKDRPKSKQRAAAQGKKEVGKTGSTPAAKRTGKPPKDDQDRRNGGDDDVISKGYGSLETAAAIQLQAFSRRLLARRMLRSHRNGTPDHQRVLAEIQRATPQLQQQADKLAAEMLRRMLDATRHLMSRYQFYSDLFHTANCTEMSGSAPDAGEHRWFLLFRLGFRVTTDQVVAVRPYVSAGFPVRTHLFDLDNKCLLDPVRHTGYPIQASKKTEGYCLVAEALSQHGQRPVSAEGRWTCWLMDQVQDRSLFSDAKHIALAGCSAAFKTRHVVDYYVPQPDQVVFDFYMRAGKGHQLTLQMETSHRRAHIKVQVFDAENNVVTSAEGVGQAVIPMFVMDGEESFLPSIAVHSGHDGKKKVPPNKKDRGGAADSAAAGRKGTSKGRTRSTRAGSEQERWTGDGGGSSSGDVSRPPRPDNWDRYRLVVHVQADTWPLTRHQWSFVHKLTEKAVARQYIHGPFEFRSQLVLPTNKKHTKKGRNASSSKGRTQAAMSAGSSRSPVVTDTAPEAVKSSSDIDRSRPHVMLRLVSTEQRADDIELFHNHDHINAIKLEKAAWETADVGRAGRASKLRLEYLDQRTCRLPANWPSPAPPSSTAPVSATGESQPAMVSSEVTTLPSSEEFEPQPAVDLEASETRAGAVETEQETAQDQPEPGAEPGTDQEQPERGSDRSQERELSDRGTEPEPELEPLYVAPQLPPPFVLNEVDTAMFLRDEPARLRVCDEQFKDEQSERHERHIDDFTRRWTVVGDFMADEHGVREEAKLEQMTSLHGSLKPSVTYRVFAEVMRDNYRIQVAATTAAQEQVEAEKPIKKKKK